MISIISNSNKSNDDLSAPVYDLKDAVVYKEYDKIRLLLEAGLDINERDYDDGTALTVAVDEGDVAMVKFLLTLGADTNVVDYTGMTPLQSAQHYHHHDIAAALEEWDRNNQP